MTDQAMTIRLAEDLYERLRSAAFEQRVHMAELVREGIEMRLAAGAEAVEAKTGERE